MTMENLDPPEPSELQLKAEEYGEKFFNAKMEALENMSVQDFFDVLDFVGDDGMKEIIESAKNTGSLGLGMYKLADDLRIKAQKAYLEGEKNPAKLMAMKILLDEIQA